MPKILYAIQGTGNGHVARAREVIPILRRFGELDIFLGGDQSEVDLPQPVKYHSKGLTFLYNRSGAISLPQTILKNNLPAIWREIKACPVDQYDLVINDFEFITAWACRLKRKKCYSLSHQAAYLSAKSPRPRPRKLIGEAILRYYAPASKRLGFHFEAYDHFIHPPVIRSEIRAAGVSNAGHYTVYLPAYDNETIYRHLKMVSNRHWQVFSRYCEQPYCRGNVQFYPVNNERFLESFLACEGVLTSAGFETPAEAIFLGKKLFVIPIRSQYEQACNAAALKKLGVPMARQLNDRALTLIQDWVYSAEPLQMDFSDSIYQIIKTKIMEPEGLIDRGSDRNPSAERPVYANP